MTVADFWEMEIYSKLLVCSSRGNRTKFGVLFPLNSWTNVHLQPASINLFDSSLNFILTSTGMAISSEALGAWTKYNALSIWWQTEEHSLISGKQKHFFLKESQLWDILTLRKSHGVQIAFCLVDVSAFLLRPSSGKIQPRVPPVKIMTFST